MSQSNTIISENRSYWTTRAATYSKEVQEGELYGVGYMPWFETIQSRIAARFPDRQPSEIRVLDIATGPGFFAIILAKAGYRVTAVDLTPSMLEEARRNAGELADVIDFREMNAEELTFADESFDVIVTRNLTWNLPHPERAYRDWHRVLKTGGLLLNFDANWYRYLFDEDAKDAYVSDREAAAAEGVTDEYPELDYSVMERIAEQIPLSAILRPDWDLDVLSDIGFSAGADTEIWKTVWNENEKLLYPSTPLFLVQAVKREAA